jgi:hypothetical protein
MTNKYVSSGKFIWKNTVFGIFFESKFLGDLHSKNKNIPLSLDFKNIFCAHPLFLRELTSLLKIIKQLDHQMSKKDNNNLL